GRVVHLGPGPLRFRRRAPQRARQLLSSRHGNLRIAQPFVSAPLQIRCRADGCDLFPLAPVYRANGITCMTDIEPELLDRARRGDREAHAALYRAFAPMVYT